LLGRISTKCRAVNQLFFGKGVQEMIEKLAKLVVLIVLGWSFLLVLAFYLAVIVIGVDSWFLQ
jgi:hypothetical protein